MNSCSIGIELDNTGYEPFTNNQIKSLILLLSDLKKKYNIPTSNFIGHSDVSPGRKQDPNIYFPWSELAENGFGYWHDAKLDSIPKAFNTLLALRAIGYDIRNPSSAIKAFKLHYIQRDLSPNLDTLDSMILYNIMTKFELNN